MGHYMTKDGVPTVCKNCMYWNYRGGGLGDCGNANQIHEIPFYFMNCQYFWPKPEYRK